MIKTFHSVNRQTCNKDKDNTIANYKHIDSTCTIITFSNFKVHISHLLLLLHLTLYILKR